MKSRFPIVAALCALAWPAGAATTDLPASAAGPLGSGSDRGFSVRVVQAPEAAVIPNNYIRALQQLNGTLVDESGAAIPNEASPGPNPDGSYHVDLVNFERDGAGFDVVNSLGEVLWSFTPDLFPGIPGSGGHYGNFAVEVLAFVELPQGPTTFGVSVATSRTDVNDDDAYVASVGEVPRDFFATKVGEFERDAPAFVNETHNENQWTVVAPSAGIYPLRIVHWTAGRGANLQLYTVIGTDRVLVNDSSDARAIKAYRRSSVAQTGAPYVGEVAPLPGSAGNNSRAAITGVILDGATALRDDSIQVSVDGSAATVTRTRTANRVAFSVSPDPNRTQAKTQVKVDFADTASTAYTRQWQFDINLSGGSSAPVTGQWDFENGNLAATVGLPLEYLGGATGLTAQNTAFGTPASFGIADLAGGEARVMKVPGDLSREIGYIMNHGIAPNGGGTRVNQYTLIMDVYVETTGPGAASLLQTSSLNNTDDGDLF